MEKILAPPKQDSDAPKPGDIYVVSLDPVIGHEQGGTRPVLVISQYTYNARTGLMVVVPMTTRIKNYPFEVPLGDATPQPTVAVADCVRSIDWRTRNAVRKGAVTKPVLRKVRQLAKLVLGLDES